MTLEGRVSKLEAKFTRDDVLKIVAKLEGESDASALVRAGLPPNALNVLFLTPQDVLL